MITNTILLPTWILMINNFNSDLTWSQKKPIFLVGQFIFLFIFFYNFTGFQKKKAIEFSWRTNIFGWQNLTFFQKCALRKKKQPTRANVANYGNSLGVGVGSSRSWPRWPSLAVFFFLRAHFWKKVKFCLPKILVRQLNSMAFFFLKTCKIVKKNE